MRDENLQWLMQWYLSQCDEDWEHQRGVDIGTLDNPGWTLKIALDGTALKGRPFTSLQHGAVAQNLERWRETGPWWVASVKDNVFEAACSPLELGAVIGVFRQWAEAA